MSSEEIAAEPTWYECPTCYDAKWVLTPKPDGMPWEKVRDICPDCVEMLNPDDFHRRAGIPAQFKDAAVQHLEPSLQRAIDLWASVWPQKRPILLLQGNIGSGKSYAAAAAVHFVYARFRKGAAWWDVVKLLDAYKLAYEAQREDEEHTRPVERLERILNGTALLVLDDLGQQNATRWAQERLWALINDRYANRKSLIVTTQFGLNALPPAVADRLDDKNVCMTLSFKGPSRRSGRTWE